MKYVPLTANLARNDNGTEKYTKNNFNNLRNTDRKPKPKLSNYKIST